ncbi:MAG: type IV pilus twitching motility protein PilT [Vallitaleaceae bacterium]|nr:type IV pilus twitching motility protein PilT [Vallitaleaceae bacterium]
MDIQGVLEEGLKRRASDVHLKVGSPPILRVNGDLLPIGKDIITGENTYQLLKSMLSISQFETLESRGEFDFSYSVPGIGRYRVNGYRQRDSYCLAMRMVNFEIPTLESLGIPGSVEVLTELKNGLVLITGPTGSGKSTTLAAMIERINQTRRTHILTLEDPIEYLFHNKKSIIGQREIGSDSHSFKDALRATLRQDPDIILVGEMRDLETIEIALTAAETGHLVLSTLHTVGAPKTIDRIIDVFPQNSKDQIRVQVASVLQGVVSQQLLPIKSGMGRVPACEILIPTMAIRNLIREKKNHQIINAIQTGRHLGMMTMDHSLRDLFRQGLITREVAIEYAFDKEELIKTLVH